MKATTTNKMLLEAIILLTNRVASLEAQIKPLRADKLYSYKEASEMLNLTVEGLKTRIKRGQIKRTPNGNRPGVLASEIKRYLREQNLD